MQKRLLCFIMVFIFSISIFSINGNYVFADYESTVYDFENGSSLPFSNSEIIENNTGISSLGSYFCNARSGALIPVKCDGGVISIDVSVVHPVQQGLTISAVNADNSNEYTTILTLTRLSTVSTANGDWCKQRLDPDKWYDFKVNLDLSKKSLRIYYRISGDSEYESLQIPHYNAEGNVLYLSEYIYDGAKKLNTTYNQNNGLMFDNVQAIKINCSSSVTNLIDNIKINSYDQFYKSVNAASSTQDILNILEKYNSLNILPNLLYNAILSDENKIYVILNKNFKSDAHLFEYLALNYLNDDDINVEVNYNNGYLRFEKTITGANFGYSKLYVALYNNNTIEDLMIYNIDPDETSDPINLYFKSGTNDGYYLKVMALSDYSLRPLIKARSYYDNTSATIVDFSDKAVCDAKKIEYGTIGDISCAHMKGPSGVKDFFLDIPSGVDWRMYSELNIEMYSVNATGDSISWVAISDNSETSGVDYYIAKNKMDFEGEWKTLKFKYNPSDPLKSEDFKIARSPLGYGNITTLNMWSTYGNTTVSDNTEMYIKRIYLTKGQNAMNLEPDPIAENIPKADTSKIKYNIAELVKQNNPNNAHPRLITTKDRLAQNISLYKENQSNYLLKSAEGIFEEADAALKKGDSEYGTPDGKRLVSTERNMIGYLAVAYLLSGDVKYKNRCFHAMEVMASWKDWNPSHYLCTAESAFAFALAYDLLYDDWNEYEKSVIRNAIATHAITPSLSYWREDTGVAKNTNNWQLVCSGGIGSAALAICDEPGYEDVCSELVSEIIGTIPRGLEKYSPDGAFPEGPGYWSYSTRFFTYIDAALTHSCGTDFGLKDLDGMSSTGYFPIYSNGPTGCFNYSDGGSSLVLDSCMFWLGKIYSVPQFGSYVASKANNGGAMFGFLQYDHSMIDVDVDYSSLELDNKFNGSEPVAFMRSSWDDNGIWLGLKGGDNQSSHGHLDIGQYVLDSQGVRWICDIGGYYYEASDENGREELWTYTANKRFKYYRNRAESHNVPVLNPDSDADQVIAAQSDITSFVSSATGAAAVVDMTEAYSKNALSAKRGFALTDNRSTVILRDEFETKNSVEFYSFITTKQQIEIDKNNPKIAYMYSGDKRIRLDVISDFDISWQTMDASPLPTSPVPYDNNAHPGYTNEAYKKLYLHAESVKSPKVSIVIRNCTDNDNLGQYGNILNISDWSKYAK